jgi:protein-disulfide isomerase
MSKLFQRGLTLLVLFVVGCAAAAPPGPTPPAPPASVNAAAPPPAGAAAAARKGASPGEGAALDAEADSGMQGGERAPMGVAPRGIGQPAEGGVLGGMAPAGGTPIAVAYGPEAGAVPVTVADPQWGNKDAPVTIVQFGDFECPFCARAELTLTELRKTYGPERLRIVWKNTPLPFHPRAQPAAEVAMVLFQRDGNDAFWAAHDAFFANQRDLDHTADQLLQKAKIDAAELARLRSSGKAASKIADDEAVAKKAGATGTPAFFINGIFLSGAQPIDRFTTIIDEQIQKAKGAIAGGTPPGQVYAKLSREQKTQVAAPVVDKTPPPPEDTSVHLVPVGSSPVRGKATALVTMVEFADYQCPFCGRVEATVQKLSALYGDRLRVVWKNNPLPFHPHAEPAAQLALEARAQKGDAAFFQLHDALFASQTHLEDSDLNALGAASGLNAAGVTKALSTHKYKAVIDEDTELADDLKALGTPHFFINGRRLVGAQPLEKFQAVIDEEIVKAEAMVRAGTPAARVYDKLMSTASAPVPEKKTIAAPGKQNPGRGPENAKVVVQYFCDFQAPFCPRLEPTLVELEKAFPGKIRIVWRNRPMPMHPSAKLAAEAAMEAFKQKGASGFWAMHALLYGVPGQTPSLERPALDGYATALGLDMAQFASALDNQAHKAEIEADEKIAEAAGINGVPAMVINGYYVSGAAPLVRLKKVVNLALSGK